MIYSNSTILSLKLLQGKLQNALGNLCSVRQIWTEIEEYKVIVQNLKVNINLLFMRFSETSIPIVSETEYFII